MISGCRANSDPAVVAAKLARVRIGPTSAINVFVEELRAQRPGSFIPYVDPDCGGVNARILMLFQDPGPMAASRGSGMLSASNDDPSAEMVWNLLAEVSIPWSEWMPWNAVPWYTGGENSSVDKEDGLRTLRPLTALLPRLEIVMTFGGLATASWGAVTKHTPALRRFQHIATLHPSVRGLTRGGRQQMAIGLAQLPKDFMHVRSMLR